jgi:hypothetical protein
MSATSNFSNGSNVSHIFAEQASRRLKNDVQEIDDALAAFFNNRSEAMKMQDNALDAYELEMKELGGEDNL